MSSKKPDGPSHSRTRPSDSFLARSFRFGHWVRHPFGMIGLLLALPWLTSITGWHGYVQSGLLAAAAVAGMNSSYGWGQKAGQKGRVIAVGCIFVCIMIIYGALYHALYTRSPLHFDVSSNLRHSKSREMVEEQLQRSQDLERQLFLASRVNSRVEDVWNGTRPVLARRQAQARIALSPTQELRFSAEPRGTGTTADYLYSFELRDGDWTRSFPASVSQLRPVESGFTSLVFAGSLEEARAASRELMTAVTAVQAQELRKLEALELGQARLNIIDCVYFSACVMNTLGSNDIAPRTTLTRYLVITQSLCTIFLVTFALTALWPQAMKQMQSASRGDDELPGDEAEPRSH